MGPCYTGVCMAGCRSSQGEKVKKRKSRWLFTAREQGDWRELEGAGQVTVVCTKVYKRDTAAKRAVQLTQSCLTQTPGSQVLYSFKSILKCPPKSKEKEWISSFRWAPSSS